MSTLGKNRTDGVAVQILNGQTSSGSAVRHVLPVPCRYFGFQIVGSSSAIVTLAGGIATSSDSSVTTLITWSSDTSGSVLSTESTAPMRVIEATVTASTGGVSAWLSASP